MMRRTERNQPIYFPIKAAGFLLLLVSVAFFVLLFLKLWMLPVTVKSASMAPTLEEGDTLLCDKLYKTGRSLKRGDLVLTEDENGERFIRRIIGMPGEMIEIVNGEVFINGCPVDESSYRNTTEADTSLQMPIMTVPSDAYFLLADDRSFASDSRDAAFGTKTGEDIEALVRFRVAPRGKMAFFK